MDLISLACSKARCIETQLLGDCCWRAVFLDSHAVELRRKGRRRYRSVGWAVWGIRNIFADGDTIWAVFGLNRVPIIDQSQSKGRKWSFRGMGGPIYMKHERSCFITAFSSFQTLASIFLGRHLSRTNIRIALELFLVWLVANAKSSRCRGPSNETCRPSKT